MKADEYRVAITPAGVRELTSAGHDVLVETRGRGGVVHRRRRVLATGAKLVDEPDEVWAQPDMVLR